MARRRRRRTNLGKLPYAAGDMSLAIHAVHAARTCEDAQRAITQAGKVLRAAHRQLITTRGDLTLWRKFSAELRHKKHRFVKVCAR
jgi:hypothetical protein